MLIEAVQIMCHNIIMFMKKGRLEQVSRGSRIPPASITALYIN